MRRRLQQHAPLPRRGGQREGADPRATANSLLKAIKDISGGKGKGRGNDPQVRTSYTPLLSTSNISVPQMLVLTRRRVDDFAFKNTPINEALVRDLAAGAFIAQQRNVVLVGGIPARARRISPSPLREAAFASDHEGDSTPPSISSIQLEAQARAGRRDDLPIISPASTSSSSTNSAISPAPRPAGNCCST